MGPCNVFELSAKRGVKKVTIEFSRLQNRMLLALRAGKLSTEQAEERFGQNLKPLYDLKRGELVQKVGDNWSLTPRGRELCPTRRALAAADDLMEVEADDLSETAQ